MNKYNIIDLNNKGRNNNRISFIYIAHFLSNKLFFSNPSSGCVYDLSLHSEPAFYLILLLTYALPTYGTAQFKSIVVNKIIKRKI